jgi:hypothetical protein
MTEVVADQLGIADLPWLAATVLRRSAHPLAGSAESLGVWQRYLRHKAGRDLVLTFAVPAPVEGRMTHGNESWGTLQLRGDLAGRRFGFDRSAVLEAGLTEVSPGVFSADAVGARIQVFPADAEMTTLARCWSETDGRVRAALELAARQALGTPSLQLATCQAEAVRYKPGNRCVIRYRLGMADPAGAELRQVIVFGKVYADAGEAARVHQTVSRLFEATAPHSPLPRPLGLDEDIGLVLTEALTPDRNPNSLRLSGAAPSVPESELRRAAKALSVLHASASDRPATDAVDRREAKRVRERTAVLASSCPALGDRLHRLGDELSRLLESEAPAVLRPVHGAMKPTHFFFSGGRAFLIDCDSTRMADPAVDVGGFLAYLRPGGVWYGRQGSRAWFEAASGCFLSGYRQSMAKQGVPDAEIDGCFRRSRLYEASRLFKIAARRPNRLNSPRSGELEAVCAAVGRLLGQAP